MHLVMFSHKKNMLLLEPTVGLLGHLFGSKLLAINEFTSGIDGLVTVLCLVRDVLDRNNIDLQRV